MPSDSPSPADHGLPAELLDRIADACFRAADPDQALEELCSQYPLHAAAIRAHAGATTLDGLDGLDELDELDGADGLDGASLDRQAPKRTIRDDSTQDGSERWLGNFRILEPLGEGGMGTVYRAEQHEPVRRQVALKVIKAGLVPPSMLARFAQERQALAALDHESIARVLVAGTSEAGQPWFAMELVEGAAIHHWCDSEQASVSQRIELMLQLCAGVQHAHQRGVIHRDLKPDNILVTSREHGAVVKIIDFGIARADGIGEPTGTLYSPGSLVGTPEYMSPEQVRGDPDRIDVRTDVYSLGVVLYELLTGELPFGRELLPRHDPLEIVRVICEEDAPKPSARISERRETVKAGGQSAGSTEPRLRRALARELDWIVLKAMAKDKVQRYESVAAFAADLRRFLDCEPVEAGPPTTSYRLSKYLRRHRVAVSAAALVLLAILAGAAVSIAFGIEAARQAELAQIERRQALQELAAKHVLAGRFRAALQVLEQVRELADGLPADAIADSEAYRVGLVAATALGDLALTAQISKRGPGWTGENPLPPRVALVQALAETWTAERAWQVAQPFEQMLERDDLSEGQRVFCRAMVTRSSFEAWGLLREAAREPELETLALLCLPLLAIHATPAEFEELRSRTASVLRGAPESATLPLRAYATLSFGGGAALATTGRLGNGEATQQAAGFARLEAALDDLGRVRTGFREALLARFFDYQDPSAAGQFDKASRALLWSNMQFMVALASMTNEAGHPLFRTYPWTAEILKLLINGGKGLSLFGAPTLEQRLQDLRAMQSGPLPRLLAALGLSRDAADVCLAKKTWESMAVVLAAADEIRQLSLQLDIEGMSLMALQNTSVLLDIALQSRWYPGKDSVLRRALHANSLAVDRLADGQVLVKVWHSLRLARNGEVALGRELALTATRLAPSEPLAWRALAHAEILADAPRAALRSAERAVRLGLRGEPLELIEQIRARAAEQLRR
jgi:serine/threonine protein kinase